MPPLDARRTYAYALTDLHPDTNAAQALFRDGHFADAIRRAAQDYLDRVLLWSNLRNLCAVIAHRISTERRCSRSHSTSARLCSGLSGDQALGRRATSSSGIDISRSGCHADYAM